MWNFVGLFVVQVMNRRAKLVQPAVVGQCMDQLLNYRGAREGEKWSRRLPWGREPYGLQIRPTFHVLIFLNWCCSGLVGTRECVVGRHCLAWSLFNYFFFAGIASYFTTARPIGHVVQCFLLNSLWQIEWNYYFVSLRQINSLIILFGMSLLMFGTWELAFGYPSFELWASRLEVHCFVNLFKWAWPIYTFCTCMNVNEIDFYFGIQF
jgi:hypothetical protein